MEGNIFESKKERELQRLRQQLASNVVKVDPNLKGYLDRYDPDVSRATLLRLQRQKIPTKEELEKLAGVKTAKKLKGRRTKDLRGEVGRAIREQKRFEKGERRYRPEEEPRIVGEPAPQPPGFHYDPEVEKEKIRVMALGQLQTARIANRRLELEARQLEINRQLADRERGERQRQFNIENRRSEEQLALEHRQLDALLDRQQDDRERFEEDIRQRQKERRLQRELQARALETKEFKTEQEKKLRELEITKRDVIEAEKLRVHDELKSRELDLLERRLDLDRERARGESSLSQADRDFLQRGFQQGLETLERRFGENEARIQEQIRTHADRVGQQQTEGSLRQPVEIKLVQPEQTEGGLRQTGPTAQEIAIGVREALKEYKIQKSPRRRLEIEEVSEEEDPIAELLESPRPTPVQTPRPSPRPLKKAEPTPLTAEEIAQPREGLFESAELVDPRNLPQTEGSLRQEGFVEERREPEPEEPEEPQGELFESGFFAGGLEAAAQNAIGFVGDIAGRAAEGIAGLLKPEIGEQTEGSLRQTGGRLDPEGQVFGLGQEIEVPRPTIQDVPSAEPERRPPRAARTESVREPAQVQTSQDVEFNVSPERISINRDILESQIKQNNERYKTEFADKFDEERERLRQAWLEQYFSNRPKLEEEKKELIRRAVYDPAGTFKPGFDANKYWRQANSYIETKRNKELLAKSEKYKTELLRQKSLLRDVDERIKEKNFKFTDAKLYVDSLTENKPEKILKGPPVLPPKKGPPPGPPKKGPPPGPPQAAGVVEEVQEEEQETQALEEGEGLLEEEVQSVIQPSEMNTNLRLFESMEGEIDAYYTRGRATGGARGDLPFMITNITDKTYKGLAPGQSVVLSQIEKDGRLGYYPGSRIRGEKIGITRINRETLRKQIKSGKLKVDRVR